MYEVRKGQAKVAVVKTAFDTAKACQKLCILDIRKQFDAFKLQAA